MGNQTQIQRHSTKQLSSTHQSCQGHERERERDVKVKLKGQGQGLRTVTDWKRLRRYNPDTEILDWVLDQKNNSGGKTSEIRIRSVFSSSTVSMLMSWV